MNRFFAIAGASFLASMGQSFAQQDLSKVEIKTILVAPGIYMLEGAGGNVGLSTGADGGFLIDDQFAPLAEKIQAAIAKVSPEPVKFLLNTHWHFDHTGGNEAFGSGGAMIVAQDNVRKRLKEGMKDGVAKADPAPDAALPIVTFKDEVTFYRNGRTIHVTHPEAAHTDGDAIVFIEDANVVHMGDTFFNGSYPFIDLDSGGGLDGYIAAQEGVLAVIDDQTRIIPGHGPLASKADLADTTAMLKDVRARIKGLIDRGLDEKTVVKADPLKDLNGRWGKGFIAGDEMTKTVYRSLTKS